MIAYGAYGIIALFQGQWMLTGFCLTVVGWLLSYIWFNVPPARFMMGDTGSFALGAGLGVVAMMTNAFFLLPIIGILFVVEAGSSLIQIFWKKVFHKKLLISAPIHHHLEAQGWGEAKIVMRFWVIAGVFAIVGVFLAVQGGIVSDEQVKRAEDFIRGEENGEQVEEKKGDVSVLPAGVLMRAKAEEVRNNDGA